MKNDMNFEGISSKSTRDENKIRVRNIILLILFLAVILIIGTITFKYLVNDKRQDVNAATPAPSQEQSAISSPEKSAVSTQESSSLSSEEKEALERANLRHVDVYQLEKTNKYRQYTHEFDESGIYTAKLKLEDSSLSEELHKHGYLTDKVTQEENHDYYLVIITTPSPDSRFVSVDMHINDSNFDFGFTSLDLGPFAVEKYGAHKPAIAVESSEGMLVSFPSGMAKNGFSARFVHWNDLDAQSRIKVVMDTVFIHEDFDKIEIHGAAKKLSFELAILSDSLESSIDYLRQYYDDNYKTDATNRSTTAQYMLNALLNKYQLQSFNTNDPEDIIKQHLLSVEFENVVLSSNWPVIPEIYLLGSKPANSGNSDEFMLWGYSGTFTFVPPLEHEAVYKPFFAVLDKNPNGEYKVQKIIFPSTSDEINLYMDEYAGMLENNDLSFVENKLSQDAMADYNSLAKSHLALGTNSEETIDRFSSIKANIAKTFEPINNPYSALARDMQIYVLDNKANDDSLQIAALFPLSEEFDNPITAAVLTASYSSTSTQTEYAKLYVVTAKYDEQTWELIDIDVQEKESLSMNDYPRLQELSFTSVYDSLYNQLKYRVDKINNDYNISLPVPLKKELPLEGAYLNLNFQNGIARFVNVHRFIRGEADSGTLINLWYAEENPKNLANTAFIEAVKNAEWTEVEEGSEGRMYSHTELGFLGYMVKINIENDISACEFHYSFDTINNTAILMIYEQNKKARYFVAEGEELWMSGIETFRINTDVSEYIIDDDKSPKLPEYREELRYITPIVGDMPGGIASITTTISSDVKDLGFEGSKITNDDDIIFWAMSLGKKLEKYGVEEIPQIPILPNSDISWDIELAPQEGVGSLSIIGFVDSKTVYIKKTYRLYGSNNASEQYYICKDSEIFDLLCELSFGEKIS